MASDPIHPLRIHKSPSSKMAGGTPRPLTEISPTAQRRNSPSWNASATGSPKKSTLHTDSSPFQSSPLESVTSPRMFWQNRHTENSLYGGGSGSPSPNRRSSIERLQKASRVKNSNILALEQKQEYDPTRLPHIERPLAKVQKNALGMSSSSGRTSDYSDQSTIDLSRSDSTLGSVMTSPKSSMTSAGAAHGFPTPSKDQVSPTKSSLSPSKFKSSFGYDSGENSISEEVANGRTLHRYAKSVTFDAAPPQVNEYEMATPDLSSIGTNSREGSYESFEDEEDSVLYNDHANVDGHEDSFDASLEDTDKTPVVGPDDWRGDSPFQSRRRYDGSPMTPTMNQFGQQGMKRSDSTASNDHRPLPPLPGAGHARSQSNDSGAASPGLSATAERMLGAHRSLPPHPPAMTSKSDIHNIGNGKMTLEERLKLMMLSDDNGAKSAAEQQRERRLRRANGREKLSSPVSDMDSTMDTMELQEEDETIGDISGLDDYQLPSRISRESIMRRVNGNKAFDRESDYNFSSPAPSSSPNRSPTRSPERQFPLDPDIPIPSTEDPTLDEIMEEDEGSVIITRSADDEADICDLSEVYPRSEADFENEEPDERQLRSHDDDDDGSHYSEPQDHTPSAPATEVVVANSQEKSSGEEVMTPRASFSIPTTSLTESLPDLGPKHSAFSQDFEAYMLPQTAGIEESKADAAPQAANDARPRTPQNAMSKPEYDGSGWGEPDDESEEPGTPESVIHHPVSSDEEEEVEEKEIPTIPEQLATIKSASGSKLKTRVSGTPADLAAMREARRQVSYEVPSIPPIPAKHRNRLSRDMGPEADATGDEFLERHPSFKNRSLTLDLDLGLSLDQDFERVIEAQKRGYLMRQNTKLVTASDKDGDDSWKARSAGNSPVKGRPQSWIVEPWNGKTRQKSVRRRSSIGVQSQPGPVPPIPGQQSNATALHQVAEEDVNAEIATAESGERGRLFVKVLGVKDLDLPLPKNERSWFSLTLDNGVHCVTTAWLELARNAPIGQEFELVVPNDLEFQLTLNVKLDKPAPIKLDAPSAKAGKPKASTFSRVFASPKKRKELEIRQREEEERLAQQKSAQARQRNAPPTPYELLSPLAAEDGSFARSYVCLKEHENRCFGRPYLAEVACFNEWATEEANFASSVKSKRGNTAVVRRAPYKIGKLEVQLLFVPRPKNSTDDDMPKSMNSCIRELKATEERMSRNFEGHLSQQGGDCPYWRRRYFKLVGTKLTAYHEATRQPRATINLANAKRLIDDRRTLTEKETMGRGGKRRRSAFAEEEEGYMFVEEGFRIRFNNGEVIDFYADTAEDKDSWMKVLTDVIGRGDGLEDEANGPRSRAKWCELVLKREEQLKRRAEGRRVHSRTKSMYV